MLKITEALGSAKKWYYTKPADMRQKIIKYGVVLSALLIIYGYFNFSGRADKKEAREPAAETTKVTSAIDNPNLLKGDIVTTLQNDIKNNKDDIKNEVVADITKRIQNGDFSLTHKPPTDLSDPSNQQSSAGMNSGTSGLTPPNANGDDRVAGYPKEFSYSAPVSGSTPIESGNSNESNQDKVKTGPVWVGGISMPSKGQPKLTTPDDGKKKGSSRLSVNQ
ncbi:hypothetical protein [Pectobacterium versatile]|uniref:hypothetical protein n=1 Tax=Pectobacterium versatile TaxID=2488639 RepID=UPI001F3B2BCF|nr:hypothetical protein [Pectobacterium versatile]